VLRVFNFRPYVLSVRNGSNRRLMY
jgi:hypothetical protein